VVRDETSADPPVFIIATRACVDHVAGGFDNLGDDFDIRSPDFARLSSLFDIRNTSADVLSVIFEGHFPYSIYEAEASTCPAGVSTLPPRI
jgi:hypothetical protein